jgi:N-formylglutamate deformylase
MTDILRIERPLKPLPLVFDSPHSGSIYPEDFDTTCPRADLESAEDSFVDELFSSAPAHGATLLCALFPRAYIDVNRAEDDIDPGLLAEAWPGQANPSARSDAGIGLIRRLVKPGVPVYARTLSHKEITKRIEKYYHPYHDALQKLIDDAHYNFGAVWHVNCHSMPSSSARPRQPVGIAGGRSQAVDFVLGDRDGTSCDPEFTHAIRDFLRGLGYLVTINDPFKGVELVARHSNPSRGRHSLQIEINKALYLDETSNKKSKDFPALKADIEKLVKFCAGFASSRLTSLAAD